MSSKDLFLGLDTSNYTTSVAIADINGEIILNERKLLEVPMGEKGLRQSDALWQHWNRLPEMTEKVLKTYGSRIAGIGASEKPRPAEGSYMPVFTAGTAAAKLISASLNVPLVMTSHQNGHFEAAAWKRNIDFNEPAICCHLSGGTLELIYINKEEYKIIGGTKDISYGQLIDRIGVLLGMSFPAGKYVDSLALEYQKAANASADPRKGLKNPVCKAFIDKTYLNLSGLENQLKSAVLEHDKAEVCWAAMDRIGESLVTIIERAKSEFNTEQVLICGGVACSSFIRNYCSNKNYIFGDPSMCSDNAAGVALIARRKLWL